MGIGDTRKKILADVKAGWGDWAGPGAMEVSPKILAIRNKKLKAADDDAAAKKQARTDAKKPNVMISDRRVKTAAKYKISDIPHPFTTREEYERSLQLPVGGEWNASGVVKVRAGTAVSSMLRVPSSRGNSASLTPPLFSSYPLIPHAPHIPVSPYPHPLYAGQHHARRPPPRRPRPRARRAAQGPQTRPRSPPAANHLRREKTARQSGWETLI